MHTMPETNQCDNILTELTAALCRIHRTVASLYTEHSINTDYYFRFLFNQSPFLALLQIRPGPQDKLLELPQHVFHGPHGLPVAQLSASVMSDLQLGMLFQTS